MGQEVELNAIDSNGTLLDAVTRNQISASLLQFVGSYFRLRRHENRRVHEFTQGDADYERFVDVLELLLACHPGIENRFCYLDRRFEWLKWLLIQCAKNGDEKQIAADTIYGESQVCPDARGVQGIPIRITSAKKVKLIHDWLRNLTVADLKREFLPEKMNEADLYKWWPPDDPEDTFVWIAKDFTALQTFYRDVSSQTESVLVVTD